MAGCWAMRLGAYHFIGGAADQGLRIICRQEEFAASLSHEITQPIASARNNARAVQRFLDKRRPNLGEVSGLRMDCFPFREIAFNCNESC
jgi:signal transduction histidine kinase